MKNMLFAYFFLWPIAYSTTTVSMPPASAPSQQSIHAQPDFNLTPGRLCTADDPDFKEYRYPEHIPYCQRNLPRQVKQLIADRYNVPQADWGKYEFDHLIPLGIGGSNGADNIWPQPHGAVDDAEKNKLELELFNLLSAGTITQRDAVDRIYNWFIFRAFVTHNRSRYL